MWSTKAFLAVAAFAAFAAFAVFTICGILCFFICNESSGLDAAQETVVAGIMVVHLNYKFHRYVNFRFNRKIKVMMQI